MKKLWNHKEAKKIDYKEMEKMPKTFENYEERKKIIREYEKKVIQFNPKVKVLVAHKTLQTWDLRKENITSLNRAHIFIKYNFIYCQKCQTYKATAVHHLNRKHRDNWLINLSLLCRQCHEHIHHFKIEKEIKILDLEGWTKFNQLGFDNISTYPKTKAEKIFVRMIQLCQKQQ